MERQGTAKEGLKVTKRNSRRDQVLVFSALTLTSGGGKSLNLPATMTSPT
jgi:hypothetical protein